MFQIGLPIGTGPRSSRRQSQWVTSTAASVGPYKLCSGTSSTSRNRFLSSSGSASPLHTTRRRDRHRPTVGSCAKTASIDGTKCTVVTDSRRISPAR